MRVAWMVVVGIATSACGGELAVPDAGVDLRMDASDDVSPATGCAAQRDPSGCPDGGYCVVWVNADAAVFPHHFPESGVSRSACASGPILAACGSEPPVQVIYDPYDNAIAWAECVAR